MTSALRQFVMLVVLVIGCGQLNLVAVEDAGSKVTDAGYPPIPDSGVTFISDAGIVVCVPNPDCFVSGVVDCHAGYQSCLPDGSLSECTPYSLDDCPGTDIGCSSSVLIDFVFIFDDSANLDDAGVEESIVVQQTVSIFSFENPKPNYRYGLIVSPACGGIWLPAPGDAGYAIDSQLADTQGFLPFISVQCIAPTLVDSIPIAYLLSQQVPGNLIPWDASPGQRYIILFTGSDVGPMPNFQQISSQDGVTLIVFSGGMYRSSYDALADNVYLLGNVDYMFQEILASIQFPCDGGS